jgi:hypothetical protein
MVISHTRAFCFGLLAICAVVAVAAFNSFACYKHDLDAFVSANLMFVGPPLLPAIVCLALPNPLRAVGACALVIPWLVLAYYTDCVRPYTGGGASMIYVAVLLWGVPSAILGALITGPVTRMFNVSVVAR